MTQNDKELLLKDLCARLPYGVIVHLKYDENTSVTREMGLGSLHDIMFDSAEGKPYLRPMSNMTEEEENELLKFGVVSLDKDNNANDVCCVGFWNHAKVQDYLNSIHIDYRRLIENGLAIEAPEGMYS